MRKSGILEFLVLFAMCGTFAQAQSAFIGPMLPPPGPVTPNSALALSPVDTAMAIHLGPEAADDLFTLTTTVTLAAPEITPDLVNQPITVDLNGQTFLIPPGAFLRGPVYVETRDRQQFTAMIFTTAPGIYVLQFIGQNTDLSGLTNPVRVTLTIGPAVGILDVPARFY